MYIRKGIPLFLIMALAVGLPAFSMVENRSTRPPTPPTLQSYQHIMSPPLLSSGGDTAWIQVHDDSSYCPGDPLMGHGGEARGGPGPMETWCFEGGPGDTCGTNPPWDVKCFSHEDVRAKPSQANINYWHIDTYRADQRDYCGDYALWCGSDSMWEGGPVECGSWEKPPGYGNQWNCIAQLALPGTFDVANGCTLLFDPRYDTECKYDYFYVDFYDGSEWVTLATFNATSNNPGAECGYPTGGNPDFWGNTDIDRGVNIDWQERSDPSWPAFAAGIGPGQYSYSAGPMFRWRFVSDGSWSDADGSVNTDGGAWIDNVWVRGDSLEYVEDFEAGSLDSAYWSFPDPDGVMDAWHIVHDPDPPYEGGDGGNRTGCNRDSSYAYRARPEQGYPVGAEWRNGWYYRLMTPAIPVSNSGCVVQYDAYKYTLEVTCDYPDESVRFFDAEYGQWCPWVDATPGELYYLMDTPGYDINVDVTEFMTDRYDSMQYAWHLVDVSRPVDFCRGKHYRTDYQVDNVSVGFYAADDALFSARPMDLLHDTFFTGFCGYNSAFDAYNDDTLSYYWHEAHKLPMDKGLCISVRDVDQVASVTLAGSIDEGATWEAVDMTIDYWGYDPYNPRVAGDCYGTLCPSDFGIADWDTGTTLWYYVKAVDDLDSASFFPRAADPYSPDHTGSVADYLTFSVLPLYPPAYSGPRILLVNGCRTDPYSWVYDLSECLGESSLKRPNVEIYGETLTDAGYCYDIYDIGGAATSDGIHPIWFDDYDAVVWLTGPVGYPDTLVNYKAMWALVDYVGGGGKLVIGGDRLAYCASACVRLVGEGCDSTEKNFLGLLGCDYIDEVVEPFSKPYIYSEAVDSIVVFGTPMQVDFDSMLVYRECPHLRDMSWVKRETAPPMGFTAQPLLEVLNPDVSLAHSAIYTEYQAVGQCVFLNFDPAASVNHTRTYCTAPDPIAPPYLQGVYEGRVELMRLILEDIFGLAPTGGGTAGTPKQPGATYGWSLAQNSPNPCVASTEIRYRVATPARVTITVYNTLGQAVRVLVDEEAMPGAYSALWDGCNSSGRRVSSGVYFYRMQAGNFFANKKLLVVN